MSHENRQPRGRALREAQEPTGRSQGIVWFASLPEARLLLSLSPVACQRGRVPSATYAGSAPESQRDDLNSFTEPLDQKEPLILRLEGPHRFLNIARLTDGFVAGHPVKFAAIAVEARWRQLFSESLLSANVHQLPIERAGLRGPNHTQQRTKKSRRGRTRGRLLEATWAGERRLKC